MADTRHERSEAEKQPLAREHRRRFVKEAAAAGALGASGMAFSQQRTAPDAKTTGASSAAIRTPLTDLFHLDYPIVLAPMGGPAGGELAAAVSNAGGLGLVGGAYGNPDSINRELELLRSKTQRKWGAGLITWRATTRCTRL